MLGVTFGSKHSYNDWGIWLEDTHINPPLPKRYIVDVPARNGLLDLTPELTPTIRFENRTLTFTFRVKAGDWSTLVSQIHGQIHGQTLDVISDLDPQWHWHGCVTVDDFSSDQRTGKLVITVDADPFKLSNTQNSYTVNGNDTITCVVDRMEISPAFELTAPTTVIYGDSSYVIESTQTTEKTLSGEIVSFADGTANPVVDLTANIEAVQDLHGYDAPWVGGAGANVFQIADITTIKSINTVGSWSGNTYSIGGVTFEVQTDDGGNIIGFNINGTATFTINFYLAPTNTPATISVGKYTFSSGTTGSSSTTSRIYWEWYNTATSAWIGNANDSFTTSQDTDKIQNARIQVFNGATISNKVYKPMLNAGQTALPFEPYSNICPISGWDEVNVNVSGINVWDEEWKNGYYQAATGAYTANANYICSKNMIPVLPSTTYYMNTNGNQWEIYEYDADGNYLRQLRSAIVDSTFATDADTHYINIGSHTQMTTYNHDISINYPSTDSSYHEYNGQTYTIDLDGTRYGGSLDVTTGVLTITHEIVDLGNLTWIKQTNASWNCFSSSITGKKNGGTVICSNYPQGAIYGTSTDKIVGVNANSNNIYVRDSSYMSGDASAFKTAMSGVQLVYELATPQTVQLTAEQVTTLKNQNNIWADSGEVEVTYIAQDFAGRKFFIPDLELTEGSHSLTIQGTGTTKVTYTNGRL